MIFVILNAALAAYLIWATMNINTKNQGEDSRVVNVMLFNSASAILMFVSVILILCGPEKVTVLCERLTLFLIACSFVEISVLFMTLNRTGKFIFAKGLKAVLLVIALYIVFAQIKIEDYTRFVIVSNPVLTGRMALQFPVTWLQVFVILYIFVCPLFSLLVMLLNAENTNSRLAIQRAVMCLGSMIFGWVGLILVVMISDMLPMMRSLILYIMCAMTLMLQKSATQEKIFDGGMIASALLSMLIRYFIPAIAGAVLYVLLRPMYIDNRELYVLIVFGVIFGLLILSRSIASGLAKFVNYRSSQYEAEFERALASIDYENELSDIAKEFLTAFQQNLQTSTMAVLLDNGQGEFSTSYSSEGKTYKISKFTKAREIMMNNNIHILFRDEVESNYLLQPVREEIYQFFDEAECDAFIILHEGHHILGILTLGEKRTGSSYDEYDKQVLNKFYSYLFVFGYYMKNIANASVVGTVNREIRMSSQIITSIQENMDYIKNPKVDVGYLMVPAHNIGGEFVDLIRLNNTRHLMIIGSMSGKGISASMSMVILKSIVRTFLAETHDFKLLVKKVNMFIRDNLPKGTFFSGVFCLMDFATDTMYYVNCGIPTLLMYSKTYNNVIEVQGKGYVLGFVKDISPLIKVKQIKLVSGDMIAITTGGLINAHSLRGEQFGKERIKQVLMDNYTYPAKRIARFLFDSLQRFMSKELEDDITVLTLRYFGKDGVAISETEAMGEEVQQYGGDFSADDLIDNAVEDMSIDSGDAEKVETDAAFEAEQKSDAENIQPEQNEEISQDSGESQFSSNFDDDMFNEDFSNPNADLSDIAGISVDDIVDPEVFEQNTEN